MSSEDAHDLSRAVQARGPAYPFVSLPKAVARVEQLRDANMTRHAASALAIYKVWGWAGDSGNARQTLAALNHFGLVDYVGRGEDRQVRLSDLAHRIVLDRVPGSQDRAAALRQAALSPNIHAKLWDRFGAELPPDVVIETFLARDCKYGEAAARNLIGEYRETFEYAGLAQPANMPLALADDAAQPEAPMLATAEAPEPVQHLPREREWLRGPLSHDTSYRLVVTGEMGPKELGKLIRLLEAQKAVLTDEDDN